ncbi:MAG: DUF2779 domain-containing protein [Spirochaetales bacterium]
MPSNNSADSHGGARLLTKSLFSLGLECPTKVYYSLNSEYKNQNSEDEFLKALADGGFQVGALARCLFPGGVTVETLDRSQAIVETTVLLAHEGAVVFEAAIAHQSLLIRADVLVKKGNTLNLYEVKAKSWHPENSLFKKRGKRALSSQWTPYLCDVAFQAYVLRRAFPDLEVWSHLLLVDQTKWTSVDGLNQKFKIQPAGDQRGPRVQVAGDVTPGALGTPILIDVPVDEVVQGILDGTLFEKQGRDFSGWVNALAQAVDLRQRWPATLGKVCRNCEFRTKAGDSETGFKSGFEQCWSNEGGLSKEQLAKPTVLELWRNRDAAEQIHEGRYLLEDLTEDDFPDKDSRQYLQYRKVVTGDKRPFVDKEGLRTAMARVRFPLHFIDFETSMLALPFHRGRHPYEQYAFQFSHHQMAADGTYHHKDQFLGTTPGMFPNFEFVRALRSALSHDLGTVFRYANHENTVLNQIAAQLETSTEPDKRELIDFCETLTHDGKTGRVGVRDMVDLLDWVKKYYYHPSMGGSNSIKAVFPAILNSSSWLQAKYSEPIYGDTITSLNFGPTVMVQTDSATGEVVSPYKNLPPVMKGVNGDRAGMYYGDAETIQAGGAAATAFARLQLSDVPVDERVQIEKALLRYCEIDTLAMVMIWEGWREMVAAPS